MSEHPLRAVRQELLRHRYSVELDLGYLSENAIATYLAERFRGSVFPDDLVKVLHQRTNGNPLFLINIIETLIRQKGLQSAITDTGLSCDLKTVTQILPESLRQLIEQRPPSQ